MNFELQNDSFQIILDNRKSNYSGEFVREFSKEIKLGRNMEVALGEISLPKATLITSKTMVFNLMMRFENGEHPEWDPEETLIKSVEVPASDFKTNEEFAESITDLVSIKRDDLRALFYNEKAKYVKAPKLSKAEFNTGENIAYQFGESDIKFVENHFVHQMGWVLFLDNSRNFNTNTNKLLNELNKLLYWKFDNKLRSLLGFDESIFWRSNIVGQPNPKDLETKAKYRFDLFEKLSAIYIYSDIVKSSHFGETKANVLRVICMDDNSEMSVIKFENLIFIPLKINNINSIGISVRDIMGDVVEFENIKTTKIPVTVTLLFRPLEQY